MAHPDVWLSPAAHLAVAGLAGAASAASQSSRRIFPGICAWAESAGPNLLVLGTENLTLSGVSGLIAVSCKGIRYFEAIGFVFIL